jgi:hypothetical protein
MALVATALLTMLLVAAQLRVPAWLWMAAAGLVVGLVRTAGRDTDAPVLGFAGISGAAVGTVAGATMALCPLLDPDMLMTVRLVPVVVALAAMATYGCLCGSAGGLVAGLMIRDWRQQRAERDAATGQSVSSNRADSGLP